MLHQYHYLQPVISHTLCVLSSKWPLTLSTNETSLAVLFWKVTKINTKNRKKNFDKGLSFIIISIYIQNLKYLFLSIIYFWIVDAK